MKNLFRILFTLVVCTGACADAIDERNTDPNENVTFNRAEQRCTNCCRACTNYNGPGEYWGLPGLILEVNAGRTTILCTEIVLNPSEKQAIEAPTKGKEITREKYNETVKIKMEEMRQNFQGRGNGGGGRRQ